MLDIAVSGGKVYAGGSFTNAGGNANADFLAVWDGASWEPFCTAAGPAFDGNVHSLQIIGQTLYVGGAFQNGAGIASADYLLACDLATGAPSPRSPIRPTPSRAPCTRWRPTATARSTRAESSPTWRTSPPPTTSPTSRAARWPMGSGGGAAMRGHRFVRGLTAVGTDVYVGTDASDVGGIPQADHVARWNGSAWSAVGAGSGGANGWFPTTASIDDLTSDGSNLFVTGTFQNANGDPRADHVAFFDGTDWHPLGSNGAGDGPWIGSSGLALAIVDRQLYAAGSFTSAGGDNQARSVASFALSQVIAYPTPTVTAGPSAVPTPTVTPGPSAVPTPTVTPAPDAAAPRTSLRKARIDQARRKATFRFASSEPGSRFLCKLDKRKFKSCASPKTYKQARLRRAHVPRQGARPRRQRRCLAGGQAVQDQEAIARAPRGRQATGRTWRTVSGRTATA